VSIRGEAIARESWQKKLTRKSGGLATGVMHDCLPSQASVFRIAHIVGRQKVAWPKSDLAQKAAWPMRLIRRQEF
jgi:hypothetical protein